MAEPTSSAAFPATDAASDRARRILTRIHENNPQLDACRTAEFNRSLREQPQQVFARQVLLSDGEHALSALSIPMHFLLFVPHCICLLGSKSLLFIQAMAAAFSAEQREQTLDYIYDAWWRLVVWQQRLGLVPPPSHTFISSTSMPIIKPHAAWIAHRNVAVHKQLSLDSLRPDNGVLNMQAAFAKVAADSAPLPPLQHDPNELVMVLLDELSQRQLPRILELPSERTTAYFESFATAEPSIAHVRLSAFVFAHGLETVGNWLENGICPERFRPLLTGVARTMAAELQAVTADYFATGADQRPLLKRLRGELCSGNPGIRMAAIQMLSRLGSASDAELLLTLYLLPPHANYTSEENSALLRAAQKLTYQRPSRLCA